MKFRDILYGQIELPEFLVPFIRLPEFVRLRGVGLSNVDSVELKDFNGPSRWEHGIAVAWLSGQCAAHRSLPPRDTVQLMLAGLLHDVATPPFAHTAEYVLPGFDHEVETQNLLAARPSDDSWPDAPVFESELPQFRMACDALSRQLRLEIDPDEVARMVVGDGDLGYLMSGTLDLDNADNVTRACLYLGWDVDRDLPRRLAIWLAQQPGLPVEIESVRDQDVRMWLEYRHRLYSAFFEAGDTELGREAFLQHLMRRALRAGILRRSVIWNTEDGLLSEIANLDDRGAGHYVSLSALVRRYRLLEPPHRIIALAIEDPEVFRALQTPQAATWIESQLSTEDLEVFVMVSARRWASGPDASSLVRRPDGALLAFKLGTDWRYEQLPEWLRSELPAALQGRLLTTNVGRVLLSRLRQWAAERPWLEYSEERVGDVPQVLESIGDWSFRLSKNDNFHAYPSTFVHAIPASLITALGLKGELVVDPFGGTGQTAVEAIKYGGTCVTSDINSIATLVARARLTYLTSDERRRLRSLSEDDLRRADPVEAPVFPNRDKWHNPETLAELCSILGLVRAVGSPRVQQFLEATFSSVLPATTARRGRQHGFFADNTPLAAGVSAPPYQPAITVFLSKLQRNVALVERLYAFIERTGRNPQEELCRATVVQLDAIAAKPSDYGIAPRSAAAIVTSPPYVGMADYSLGNRLSYYWLLPSNLSKDFELEVGARRKRTSRAALLAAYLGAMENFALRALELIRPGGFLAVVVGSPQARLYAHMDIGRQVEQRFLAAGFKPLWSRDREISWHRNHGYQRLTTERVSVYVAPQQAPASKLLGLTSSVAI
jgi:HD superfamily phosphohydrolase